MGKEWSNGSQEPDSKARSSMVANKELVDTSTPKVVSTRVTLTTTTSIQRVCLGGVTGGLMRATGNMAACMDMAYTCGQTEINIRVIT